MWVVLSVVWGPGQNQNRESNWATFLPLLPDCRLVTSCLKFLAPCQTVRQDRPFFLSGVLPQAFYHSSRKSSSHTWSSGPVVSSFSVVIGIAMGDKLLQIDPIKFTVFTGEFFFNVIFEVYSPNRRSLLLPQSLPFFLLNCWPVFLTEALMEISRLSLIANHRNAHGFCASPKAWNSLHYSK